MRTEPPVGFDASDFYADVVLFQSWDVFPGHTATGVKSVEQSFAYLSVPAWTDCACWKLRPGTGFSASNAFVAAPMNL
jgi:hypothetical protein